MSTDDDPRHLIQRALNRDPEAVRVLLARLSPVVEHRVAVTLWQRGGRRNVQQEVRDMTQAVFLSLFEADGKALRAWDPARGTTLEGFVSLLTSRQVISLLRMGRTSPWKDDPTDPEDLQLSVPAGTLPEEAVGAREHLRLLLDGIREELSPAGLEIFQRLIIDQEPIDDLSLKLGMTTQALYQWRHRLLKLARSLSAKLLDETVSDSARGTRTMKESYPR